MKNIIIRYYIDFINNINSSYLSNRMKKNYNNPLSLISLSDLNINNNKELLINYLIDIMFSISKKSFDIKYFFIRANCTNNNNLFNQYYKLFNDKIFFSDNLKIISLYNLNKDELKKLLQEYLISYGGITIIGNIISDSKNILDFMKKIEVNKEIRKINNDEIIIKTANNSNIIFFNIDDSMIDFLSKDIDKYEIFNCIMNKSKEYNINLLEEENI